MIVAVNEIVKKPRLLSLPDEIVYIEDKRKHEIKSVVIPARYIPSIKDALKKIEYAIWLKRNEAGLVEAMPDYGDIVTDIGKKLED